MIATLKPKLDTEGLLSKLEGKGIKFEISSKEMAAEYLSQNNNYFKLSAYRKTFQKHPDGENKGKYVNLDFEMLKDLAIIDMRLRYALLHMALDVEHFSKVRLLKMIESRDENGYQIVTDYIESLEEKQKNYLKNDIEKKCDNPYCGDIIKSYRDRGYPIWAFLEIITLGSYLSFYRFCAERFENKSMKDDYYLLLTIKDLRNATAHSNCIINDLSPKTAKYDTSYLVSDALGEIGISKEIRSKKMSNERIREIITLLYTHMKMVPSKGVHDNQCRVLSKTIERMFKNIEYYKDNDIITTTFEFLKKVVDKWYTV